MTIPFALAALLHFQASDSSGMPVGQLYSTYRQEIVTVHSGDAIGTGFFVEGKLYTCYHVIKGGENSFASFTDGSTSPITSAVSVDPVRDIAVLNCEYTLTPRTLKDALTHKRLHFGDYSGTQVGERLVVIGSPRGLDSTLTEGVASGKRHDSDRDLLQLSAAVSPGSSGSPVINMKGQVIGMVTSSVQDSQALNFAVSSKDIKATNGVPMDLAFSRAAPRSLFLLDPPAQRDSSDLQGYDSAQVVIGAIPSAIQGSVNTEDVKRWVIAGMSAAHIELMDENQSKKLRDKLADNLELAALQINDQSNRIIYVDIDTASMDSGLTIFLVRLNLQRAGFIYPGKWALVSVKCHTYYGAYGFNVLPRTAIQRAVETLMSDLANDRRLPKSAPR